MALGTCPSIAERFLSAASAAVRLCGYTIAHTGTAWRYPVATRSRVVREISA